MLLLEIKVLNRDLQVYCKDIHPFGSGRDLMYKKCRVKLLKNYILKEKKW